MIPDQAQRIGRMANLTRGTKSIHHHINKKVVRSGDAEKLDYIQTNIKLPTLREITIRDNGFTTANKLRIPDLTIQPIRREDPNVICELDSFKIHGELSSPNIQTQKRNSDYYRTNRPFFVVNEDLADQLGLDRAKLANYLYYHCLMLELCYAEFLKWRISD